MNKINYQKEMEKVIKSINQEDKPSLLLHSCCAPCSSYVLEYLAEYFNITVYFYNPNINVDGEYEKRKEEQKRFISEFFGERVKFLDADFEEEKFFEAVKGYEDYPEGSERCKRCYKFRLEKTAEKADELEFDYFTTTLSISPLKNSMAINNIGIELEEKYKSKWLKSDFKKKNGYKRSTELSNEYNLYRQDYCGCIFSKAEAEQRNINRNGG